MVRRTRKAGAERHFKVGDLANIQAKAAEHRERTKAEAVSKELNEYAAAEREKEAEEAAARKRVESAANRGSIFKPSGTVLPGAYVRKPQGARRTSKLGTKFNRCVKSVRKTVKARPKSTKESAAIAICTKSVLQSRGRTLKRYRRGRLTTQRRR
jgi:hypothetical protein